MGPADGGGSADGGWFSVRCVFRFTRKAGATYEERVTLWRAVSIDEAIALAEREASDYAAVVGGEYLCLAQAYALADEPLHGAEIFSLMRDSGLAPDAYLDAFFDTGNERQAASDAS